MGNGINTNKFLYIIKGSLDEKLPSYELLKMLKVIDSKCNRFVKS